MSGISRPARVTVRRPGDTQKSSKRYRGFIARGSRAAGPVAGRGRQPETRQAPRPVLPVLERQPPAVTFGDLPGEDQPDAGAVRLGREERDEQVAGRGQAGAAVLHQDLDMRVRPAAPAPRDGDAATRLARRIDGVADEIDED